MSTYVDFTFFQVSGILLQPIIPTISNNLLNKLSISQNERNFHNIRPYSWEKTDESSDSPLLSENVILFRKLKAPKEKKEAHYSKVSNNSFKYLNIFKSKGKNKSEAATFFQI